jgi:hypothetical protein
MILSIKHKFIFIHIPKTGGESITDKMRWHMTKERRYEDLQDFIYWGSDDKTDLAHIYQSILESYVPRNMISKYFKFCIVRNPYNRCYSAYKDLFLGAKNKHAVKSSYGVWVGKYNKPSSFSEYCKMLGKVSSNTPTIYNIHVIPQYMYIYNGNKKRMDYIGHYETMDKDMKHIYEKFKLQKELWFDKPNTYNIKVDNLKKSYMKELSHEDIHLINSVYFADFILFDYPIVIPHVTSKSNKPPLSTEYKDKLELYFKKLVLKHLKLAKSNSSSNSSSNFSSNSSRKVYINIKDGKISNNKGNHDQLLSSVITGLIDKYNVSNKELYLDKKMITSNKTELETYIYYMLLLC